MSELGQVKGKLKMLNPEILSILRCPTEGSPLVFASDEIIERTNQAIRDGQARDALDERVHEEIEGGLMTESGDKLYPIRNGIPSFIPDESIRLLTAN